MTKDPTPTPAGRERADSGSLAGTPAATAPDLDAIRARLDAYKAADTSLEFMDCAADLRWHAPADLAALLDEVEQWRTEADLWRDKAGNRRAALAALRADVEALIVTEYDTASDEAHGTNPRRPFINPDDLAAVLAKHAEEDA